MGQKLRGLVGQGMSGGRHPLVQDVASYPPGSYTFSATKGGLYKFVLWGPGGTTDAIAGDTNGAGSGAYVEAARTLAAGQAVSVVVGAAGPTGAAQATSTTVVLPNGDFLTAGGGYGGSHPTNPRQGGVASVSSLRPGDVLLNGSAGGAPIAGNGQPGAAGLGTGGGSAGGAGSLGASGGGGAPGNLPFRGGVGSGPSANVDNGARASSPGGGAGSSQSPQTFITNQGGDGLCFIFKVRIRV